ncbi:Ser/Thr protein kinase RdoA (MazF antagonist) [Paenibacillus phyllosphaerae]|uniref:Ser/Thr protein kinase RdoA (MazF antagonist) n=1 Tax=Paenibacillus phyllosphaerae TaxID=274593 RepID=A0A7W5AX36_9BACL|nr:phosphotransferase [Paenibacillus phyllosphaerae]MBB3110177.1 Ser/Thr protein kinase RdoA (MazF antagonist) [Paenibacillus phyllosphaerae]
MLKLAVNHAVISSQSLITVLNELYAIGEVKECRFLENGLNDTYLVKTASDRYILRIYKFLWRSQADVQFEIELLNYLAARGISVSTPLRANNDDYFFVIDAPEGPRYAALFTYAEGVGSEEDQHCAIFGEEVANMHLAMDDFRSTQARFEIDAVHLLDEPLRKIRPFLSHRPDDFEYLTTLAAQLLGRIEQVASELDWGCCHGDLHGWNVHFDGNQPTQFDFDCGGLGWRSYDVSVFLWSKVSGKKRDEFDVKKWTIFIDAYQKVKPLAAADLQAIPVFVAIRDIWLMGLHTGNAPIWGHWQNDAYFDRHLAFLRDWCAHQGIVDKG